MGTEEDTMDMQTNVSSLRRTAQAATVSATNTTQLQPLYK